MSGLIDGVGLVSGVLGIVGFIQDNVPDKPPEGAIVRVKLGLGDDDDHGIVSLFPSPFPDNHSTL